MCGMKLEGVVSKRADGRYISGRSSNWVKVTCRHRDTFAVVGWAEDNGKFDGLYLDRAEKGHLVYSGKIERGFSESDKLSLLARLRPLHVRAKQLEIDMKKPKARWVKPRVLVDVESRGKTPDGLLRHPSFKGGFNGET
jgi:bifunctional non-homologous end joining protein LigD